MESMVFRSAKTSSVCSLYIRPRPATVLLCGRGSILNSCRGALMIRTARRCTSSSFLRYMHLQTSIRGEHIPLCSGHGLCTLGLGQADQSVKQFCEGHSFFVQLILCPNGVHVRLETQAPGEPDSKYVKLMYMLQGLSTNEELWRMLT